MAREIWHEFAWVADCTIREFHRRPLPICNTGSSIALASIITFLRLARKPRLDVKLQFWDNRDHRSWSVP